MKKLVLAAGALVLLSGAVFAADPQKARKKLEKEDIAFTSEMFLKKVFSGDEDIVQLFLDAGMPVDTADEKGWTALHRAAQGDSEKTLAVILKAKPDLNARTKAGDTPLCRAAASGSAKNVMLLVQAGADVNAVCSFQKTALHEAAHQGDAAKVSALLAGGAKTETRDDKGQTPLHLATSQETPAAANALIQAKADVNAKTKSGRTPLHDAVGWDKPAIVSALLAAGADVDARDSSGRTPLYEAAGTGRMKILPLLLAAGADPQARTGGGETPEKAARASGETAAAEMLKNAKKISAPASARADAAPSSASAPAPSASAARTSPADAAQELKKMGLKADKKTLFERVEAQDVKAVRLIVDAGVSPKIRNDRGRTPLYVAVEAGAEEMVEALLASGADPNDAGADVDKSMEYGDTLVMRAVDRNSPRILKALVAAKADLNKGNAYGVNGLMSAGMQGRADLVSILVAGGANVNARDKNGTPALYSAVQGGNADAVKILIDAGADTSVNRKLLLDTAKSKNDPKLVAMLEKAPPGKVRKAASDKSDDVQSDDVQSDASLPPPQPTVKSASTGTGKKPITGRQAYDLFAAVTAKWQKDAGLTELSTTSEGPLDAQGRSAHWVGHFYSASAKQVLLANIDGGKITHIARASNELRTVEISADTILDTKRLRDIAEEASGSKCSAKGATLSAGLVPNRGRAFWYFNYSDRESQKNICTIVVNANGGKVELTDIK